MRVLKVETGCRSFQNIMEWLLWEQIGQTPEGMRWLIPCVQISPRGSVLVQERGTELNDSSLLPIRIPTWMGDIKPGSFGLYRGKARLWDYGCHKLHACLKNADERPVPWVRPS